jgi:sec-independent protein translocase protein TatA
MVPLRIPGGPELLIVLVILLLFLAVPAGILLLVLARRRSKGERVETLEQRVDELERELEREIEREHAADERDEPPVGDDPPGRDGRSR